ncbi:nicotinate-nucleotide--dimethylbenzimidazole phosphoribosyltransferase [Streptomyces sp. NPDC005574]|uniref:nicotinate-nucleotide--dimethylbenzimidazole phosphoribosyltransferase n=1 Tax=Streptomyces sp. NPDC005574 TaxID=3156891 RepID=UPI00339E7D81
MTDTGQVPGEGLPESAGMVEEPGVAAHGAYTYLSETTAEDEDLLLLPGAQGAWGNEVAPPAPEPVVETVHEPGPHEMSGRDSGSVDLSGVRLPSPAPAPAPVTPRRPLHLGPPIPDASASPVRSLADRGPAGVPVRQSGPATTGPEYLDVPLLRDMPPQGAAWGAQAQTAVQAPVNVQVPAAETVAPATAQTADAVGVAQAVVARIAAEADAVGDPATADPADGADPQAAWSGPVAQGAEGASGAYDGPVTAGHPAEGPALTVPEVAQVPAAGAGPVPVGDPAPDTVLTPDAVGRAPGSGAEIPDGPVGVSDPEEGALDTPVDPAAAASGAADAPQDAGAPQDTEAGQAEEHVHGPADAQFAAVETTPESVPAAPVDPAPGTVEAPADAYPEAAHLAGPGAAHLAEPAADHLATPVGEIPGAQVPDAEVQGADVPGAEAVGSDADLVPAPAAEVPDAHAHVVPAPAAEVPDADAHVVPAPAAEVPDAHAHVVPAPAAEVPDADAHVVPADAEAGAFPEPVPSYPETDADAVADLGADQQFTAPEAAPAPEPALAPVPEPAAEAEPVPAGFHAPAPHPRLIPEAHPDQGPQLIAATHLTQAPLPTPDAGPHEVSPTAVADPAVDHTAPAAHAEAPAPPLTSETSDPQAFPALEAFPAPEAAADFARPAPQAEVFPPSVPLTDPPTGAGDETPVGAAPQDRAAGEIPEPVAPHPAESAAATAPAGFPEPAGGAAEELPADVTAKAAVDQGHDHVHLHIDAVVPLPASVPPEPGQDRPLGEFVPVEGSVPSTPHLAPTPPRPLVLPLAEEQPATAVPAPREADPVPAPAAAPEPEHDPELVQHADDLDTRAADQEESTAAVEDVRQSTGPAAPAYDDAEREAVLKVMRERRDIRNGFRDDPIPHEVLLRVLEAAHTAPSVGHSQPWDFVVIRSAETRRSMHELAVRQRDAYAKSLPKGRAKQFKELKIEAILDTPVNIVVTADPTRGGRHTLGRHTQPQMAPYSSALAVENLWLAARAEGLGVGWVSFFDEREMVRALGLPEHLEVVAYLCVGYVDEFPDEPELMQAGWSKRRPLSWVVHEETYGRRALPGEDPHDLLAETVAQIRPLDAKALGEAWDRQKRMTKPAGALGMLEIISAQLSGLSRQCPPPIPEPAAVAIFAGDHGVHAQGVTPWPQEVTAQMVANFLGGGAVCNAFATQVGAEVCVIDVGVAAELPATPGLLPRKVRAGTSDMTTGPAMTREEARQAIEVGIETARDLVAAGNKALLTGEMGIANTTASAALISVFTDTDPADVTGRGTGINDETLARKTEVVRRAIELHQPDPADPIGVLAAIGGFEHAAIVGLLLGGASLRTPVILDGVSAGAAALVARAIAPEVLAACIAGHRSAEPGHVAALNKLGLRPLVDLDLRLGEGTGALLALPLVQSTARAMHEVATFDSAGVTEK